MVKPTAYNYRKAEDRILQLEGNIIHLQLELREYLKRNEPQQVEKRDTGKYHCPKCEWTVATSEKAVELIKKEKLNNYCPYCGQKLKW